MAKRQYAAAGGARSFVRFQQVHHGIPVVAGEIIVQVDDANNIISTSGELLSGEALDTDPAVEAASTRQAAVQSVAKKYKLRLQDLTATDPELWIYEPSLIGPDNGPAILAWRLEVKSTRSATIRELVLVDAQRGSIALSFNQIDAARALETKAAAAPPPIDMRGQLSGPAALGSPQISVFTMNHSSNEALLPGTLVCTQSNPAACNSDPDAQNAYQYALATYNYYATQFDRDSINGLGMTIVSSVHFGSGYDNAFWDGSQMVYGDGFSIAEDVVGHELTHGVTDYESSLFYYYQSGAINESVSDVFGEFVEKADQGDADWLLGEALSGGAVRDMSNPPAYGDPDKMTSGNYSMLPPTSPYFDNGGVHANSGLNNKAAYLMTDGAAFNGYTIGGLGLTKVASIYYEAQTNLLTSGADYSDLASALYQGCLNLALLGTSGITGADCVQVQNATLAVEMNSQPVAGFNPDAVICPGGQAPNNVFFDNLESGAGNWTHGALVGSDRWSYGSPYGAYSHSGTGFLYADDYPDSVDNTYVAMNSSVSLPADAYLHFYHAYGFENTNYDGGVVEYSTNGGGSWSDAGSLFDTNGYTGTLSTSYGNPLGGRSAFTNDSHGYYSSRLNLNSLSGQNVRFRWRMGLDSSAYNWGWWLDDVRIYTCPGVAISGNAGVGGATLSYTDGTPKTATANGSGDYSFHVPYNWSGTVTPSKAGYTFTPDHVDYGGVAADQAGQDYTAAILTYTLTYTPGPHGTISGASPQTVNYGAAGTPVTAVPDPGYAFVDWSDSSTANPKTDTNVTANVSVTANFAAGPHTISGTAGVAGVSLAYTGGSTSTDGGGNYSLTVPDGWSGTVTPAKTGYAFTPDHIVYTGLTTDLTGQDYTATILTFTLTYAAGPHGTISGASPQTVNYGAAGTPVTAIPDPGYAFVDWSDSTTANPRTDTNVTVDISVAANFAAGPHTISGNAGVGGATLTYTGGSASADASGNYSLTVPDGWSGTVTPYKLGYDFTPPHRTYNSVNADMAGENYTSAWRIGTWVSTGSLATSRYNHGLALLKNGRVLATGGRNVWLGGTPLASSEIYDPEAGTWSASGNLNTARIGFGSLAVLNDGRALLAGGNGPGCNGDCASVEIFDPAAGAWAYTGSLNTPRRGHTVVVLTDGTVLAAGGRYGPASGSTFPPSSEVYDPVTGTWSYAGNLQVAGEGRLGVRLFDGRVLIAGGEEPGGEWGTSAQLYDPTTKSWSLTGSMSVGFRLATLALLGDGTVLRAGGSYPDGSRTSSAEIYDPATGLWTLTTSMHRGRQGHTATLLPDGRVLVAGGSDSTSTGLTSSEVYDPATRSWTEAAPLQVARATHEAVFLGNGQVLVVGGLPFYPPPYALASSELYGIGGPTLSGNAGVGGVILSYADSAPRIAAANGSGDYSLHVPYNWSGTVTPSKAGHTFTPDHIDYPAVTDDLTGQDYTATVLTYTLTYTPGPHGRIAGPTPQAVDYGASGTAVTAVPDPGYFFINWSDGSTANPRIDTYVTGNLALTANFASDTITVDTAYGGAINGDGECSLYEAISNANGNAASFPDCATGHGADTIDFDSALTSARITLTAPLPTINDPAGLTIDSTCCGITVDGNNLWTVFAVGAPVTLKWLSVERGNAWSGGGAYVYPGASLTVDHSQFYGNQTNSDDHNNAGGAGVYNNQGTLRIDHSTFWGNYAVGEGGAVHNWGGTVHITNSTFAGNSAAQGGALANWGGLTAISNSTFAGNFHTNSNLYGNGLRIGSGALNVHNSVLDQCWALSLATISGGNNVVSSTIGCGFTNGTNGNIVGFGAGLGALTGFPAYFPLNPDSLGIDAGDNSTCPNTDQRDVARPQGLACDIGAFELKHLTISGNAGVGRATLSYAGASTSADNNGDYSISIPEGWSGTVTPSKAGYAFTPDHIDYPAVTSDQAGQDYTATANSAGALPWNTFLGGTSGDGAQAIAADTNGNVYVAGTSSSSWGCSPTPCTAEPYGVLGSSFVAKLDPSGDLIWNTFIGGSALGIALDESGEIYVAGVSAASWGGPVRSYSGGGVDAFVAKLDPYGDLLWNTFLGGDAYDWAGSIAVDSAGDVYVSGWGYGDWTCSPTTDCTVRPYPSGGQNAGYAARLDASGNLTWNTFLGSGQDWAYALAVDAGDGIYVTGLSNGAWSCLPPEAECTVRAYSSNDAYVAKLGSNGWLIWNTFLGGAEADVSQAIAVDGSGSAYVTGFSRGTWGNPVRSHTGDWQDAFAAKLDPSGALDWNTFLGGNSGISVEAGYGIAVDGGGNVYVAGKGPATWGTPVRPFAGSYDAFAARLDPWGGLTWNTFLGSQNEDQASAVAVRESGNVYVAGTSYTSWGTPVRAFSGGSDAFVSADHLLMVSGNAGVGGAALTYNGGSTTSDSSGYYSIPVPSDWSGTVTPSKTNFTFAPTNKVYSGVTSDLSGEDYTATMIALPTPIAWVSPAHGSQACPMPPVGVDLLLMGITPSPWTLKLDDVDVTTAALAWELLMNPPRAITMYTPTADLALGAHHAEFDYETAGGPKTLLWNFTVASIPCPTDSGSTLAPLLDEAPSAPSTDSPGPDHQDIDSP